MDVAWLAGLGVLLLLAGIAALVYDLLRRRRDSSPYFFPDSTTRLLDDTLIQPPKAPAPTQTSGTNQIPAPSSAPAAKASIPARLQAGRKAAAGWARRHPRKATALAIFSLAALAASILLANAPTQPRDDSAFVVGISGFAGAPPENNQVERFGDYILNAGAAGGISNLSVRYSQARPANPDQAESELARLRADALWWGEVGPSGDLTLTLTVAPSLRVGQQDWQRFGEPDLGSLLLPRHSIVRLPLSVGTDPLVPLTLALAHLKSGNFQSAAAAASGARATLEAAGGTGQVARLVEAHALLAQGDPAGAVRLLGESESAGRMPFEALIARATARLQLGDFSGAGADADRVISDREATGSALARAYLARARSSARLGELAQALADLDQSLNLDPGYLPARLEKAEVFYRQSQPDSARTELDALLRSVPQAAPAHRLMGLVKLMLARPEEALESLSRANSVYSGWIAALRGEEARAQVAGDTAQAHAATEGIVRLNRELAAVYLCEGLAWADIARKESPETFLGTVWRNIRGEPTTYERALAKLREAARLDPKRADAYLQMSSVYTALGDPSKAAEALRTARSLNATAPEPYLALARLQAAQGNAKEAVSTLNELLANSPRYYPAYEEKYNLYSSLGDGQSARDSLQRGLQVPPQTPSDHLWRGKFYRTLGMNTEAAAELEAAAQDPQLWEARLYLGRIRLQAGRGQDALAEYKQVLAAQPNHPEALLEAGRLLAGMGDIAEAEKLFERLTRLSPGNADGHIAYLQLLLRKGEVDRAIAEGRRGVQADGKRADTHFYLGDAYAAKGEWSAASDEYKVAIERDRTNFDALIRLARTLFLDDRYIESMQASQSAISMRQDDPQPYRWLAEARLALGDPDGALASLQTALRLSPSYADALALAALASVRRGDDGAAVSYAQQAVQSRPDNVVGLLALGEAHLARGRAQEALQAFGGALEVSPTDARAVIGKGRAYSLMNDKPQALKLYTEALQIGGYNAEAHLYAGHAYAELGRWDEAFKEYRGAVEARPRWPLALYYLGRSYLQRKDAGNAQAAFAKATQYSPNLVEAWFGLGIAHRERGQRKEAIDALRRATQLNTSYADAWLYLGLMYEETGERALAYEAFTRARDTASDPGTREQAEKGLVRVQ